MCLDSAGRGGGAVMGGVISREWWGGRLFSWLHSRYHPLASARDPPPRG